MVPAGGGRFKHTHFGSWRSPPEHPGSTTENFLYRIYVLLGKVTNFITHGEYCIYKDITQR